MPLAVKRACDIRHAVLCYLGSRLPLQQERLVEGVVGHDLAGAACVHARASSDQGCTHYKYEQKSFDSPAGLCAATRI
eukprot:534298-Prymnesium_polylepis.2